MSSLRETFSAEMKDIIESISQSLLKIEDEISADLIEKLFRDFHTIKGSSGIFDLPTITRAAHCSEDYLDHLKAAPEQASLDGVDALLAALDIIENAIETMEAGREDVPDEPALDALAKRFAALMAPGGPGPVQAGEDGVGLAVPAAATAGIAAAAAACGPFLRDAGLAPGTTFFLVKPDASCYLLGQDPLLLLRSIAPLSFGVFTAFEPDAEGDGGPAPAEPGPLDCALGIFGTTARGAGEIADLLRFWSARSLVIEGGDGLEGLGAKIADAVAGALRPGGADAGIFAAGTAPAWRKVLAKAIDGAAGGSVSVILGAVVQAIAEAAEAHDAADPASRPPIARDLAGLFILHACLQDQSAPVEAVKLAPESAPEPEIAAPVPDTPVELAQEPVPQATAAAPAQPAPKKRTSIRVDEERLTDLMNLIGELVVAKNALPYIVDRATSSGNIDEVCREVQEQYHIMDRLAHEMQASILKLRLVPVSVVFDRFPRLVRDISRKVGKEVRLEIEGGGTEIDKSVVDTLNEPMIHLIRNALDHGLEAPEVRRAAGKPAACALRISASGSSEQVVIRVEDDGRGIDPDRISEKALAKGIVTERELAAMTRPEVLELIFRPGFSTVSEVSDLSGRGVGMDSVITAVRNAGGTVEIDSEVGHGTAVTLKLPLSMAITKVVIVSVGGELYGFPMDLVFEMCRIGDGDIQRVNGGMVAILRGNTVPLISLPSLFDAAREEEPAEKVVVVSSIGDRLFGFIVDALHERMETMVKPLDAITQGLIGFSGTAVMGDGRVLLVINPEELSNAVRVQG